MPTFKSILVAGAAAMLPLGASAYAAQQEAPVAEVVAPDLEEETSAPFDSEAYVEEQKAKMQKEMDEAIALIEKMFDTGNLPPIEPARLALAQKTMGQLVPGGSLEKMMDNLYGKMFKTLMGEFGGQSDLMLSIKTGVESEKIAALDEATKTKVADMFDPHRKEREEQITRVIKPLISEVLSDMESPMREGMAKAYARKFSAAQLTDLNGFLATPTGALYANEWMALQADPEVMLAIIKAVPPLITKFIDRAPQIEKDMKDLPKEKQLADFDDKQLAQLARLMKVDVKVLQDQRDMWKNDTVEAADAVAVDAADDYAADAATDAANAAADAAAMAVDDPAYDRSNWSADDLKRVMDLEAASAAATTAYLEAEAEAANKARERLPD
ncbi:DUF2059 domain-containing protein [Sphingopyxis sp. RIFCSPHIGHO2_12_FULL_65_19]|uniref:DUF2059 domain-containing protein n=1 Tax=Sphingopyxis sp. RIFCSPHIGHO2_12_FULL_65_19 TaxID=1802172 RepID=UPI0008BD6FC1|nr:DUF2059 domain-containing protein [Sphingopyxis sp. RIFCSPHIGHO2_12_FULL_65_19]OHD05218.1 MAG: hypothetical protein A3E77_01570 [Sphingopyxis sp. RIFCSPHIGHO2_12_FULL_65_19]